MKNREIQIPSAIDGQTFREFALFDVLRRQKRWVRPVIFAAVFLAFSLIAFSQTGKKEQAALLGWVLLAVGLTLPAVYFFSFFRSVDARSRQFDGKTPAYLLILRENGLTVKKGEETLSCAWGKLYAVHRLKNCICLYTDRLHAFLLPRSCGEELYDEAERMIARKRPRDSTHWQ